MISEASRQRLVEAEKQQAANGGHIIACGIELSNADYKEVPCRDCGKLIVWMKTRNNKNMPVNAETAKFGDALFDASKGHVSHFSDCPGADKFRKPR